MLAIDEEKSLLVVTMYLPLTIERVRDGYDVSMPRNNYNNILYLDLVKRYANLKWVGALHSDDYSPEE